MINSAINVSRQRAAQTASGVAQRRQLSAKAVTDDGLIMQIASGDKDALRLLFVRHNTRVFRFLLRIVGNETTAEDLLNEAFIEVWHHAGGFESHARATT